LLLKACEFGRVELDSIFTKWADSLTAAGAYARKDIESVYNLTFTDSQWQVLLEEIDRKGPRSVKDVIEEVVPNIEEYEERLASEQMDDEIDDLTGPASLDEDVNDLEGEAK
jgi:hypothetical protein